MTKTGALVFRSDDDRNGAAVRAPGGTGHVARAVGAQEDDDRGDLLGLGEPAEWAPRADLREHLFARAAACWSASPPSPSHASVAVGPA